MTRDKSLLVLLLFSIIGSTVSTIPVQLSYSSTAQETSDDNQQDKPVDEEPVDKPEPVDNGEPTPVDEPVDEEDPNALEGGLTGQQQELTLDIISANGLTLINGTSTDADGDGVGGGDGTVERQMTCVGNSQGQTFCYEPLPTEENCLKPMNVEDPPLCLPKGD
jgi:hypothetical protein